MLSRMCSREVRRLSEKASRAVLALSREGLAGGLEAVAVYGAVLGMRGGAPQQEGKCRKKEQPQNGPETKVYQNEKEGEIEVPKDSKKSTFG